MVMRDRLDPSENLSTTTLTAMEPVDETNHSGLLARYQEARAATERLCEPLVVEDYVVQTMPDTSPVSTTVKSF